MARPGIPTLNEETKEKFLTAIRAGNFLTAAAGAAGVSRRTIYRWKEKGEQDLKDGRQRTKYARFLQDLEQAEGEAEFLLVNKVMQTERGPLEILKRRFRDTWGDSIKAEHSGPDGGPIQTQGSCTLNLTTNMPDGDPFEIDEDATTPQKQDHETDPPD